MGHKINKVRIGVQKVYPGEITETYTIAKVSETSGSYANKNVSIYKSGYKIKNVLIETVGKSLGGYGAIRLGLWDDVSSYNNVLQIYSRVGYNTPKASLNYFYQGTSSDVSSSIGPISASGTNTYSMNITRFLNSNNSSKLNNK